MIKGLFKRKLTLLTTGLILGILVYVVPSITLSILVLVSIFSFLAKRPQAEKKTLKKIIIIAIILRLIFFTISMFVVYSAYIDISKYPVISKLVGHTIQVVQDFDREIENGMRITRYLKGEFGSIPVKEISVHGVGFLHSGAWTQGILNYIFGFSIFNLLLFPLIDLWSVILVYYLGKKIFNERVAAFSSFIYAVMPTTIVLSCTNLRFSLGILSLLLIALSLVNFSKVNNFKSLLMLAVSTTLFVIMKEKAAAPIFVILPLILLITLNIKLRFKVIFLIFVAAFVGILCYKTTFIEDKFKETVVNILASQRGFVVEAEGRKYEIYDEQIYSNNIDITQLSLASLLKFFPEGLIKGVLYFILVPFPWDISNTARLYVYPQIIFWYFIIPFALLGMIRSLFFKIKDTYPIILLCIYFMVLLSLTLGNEGIATRFRELIAPFFYIFAGSILCKLFLPRKELKIREQ